MCIRDRSYIEVVGLSRILCCQGINLLYYRQDAIALALVANQEGCLVHVAQLLRLAHGTGYLEVGKTVNLSGAEDVYKRQCLTSIWAASSKSTFCLAEPVESRMFLAGIR